MAWPYLQIHIIIYTLQLDLKLEAENLLKFQNLMNGYENIKFPTPITPFVTNSVLVESFEVNFLLYGSSDLLIFVTLALASYSLLLSLSLVWSTDLQVPQQSRWEAAERAGQNRC